MYEKCFITGCDKQREWTLPWFVFNYKNYNNLPLAFADFGVSEQVREWVHTSGNFETVLSLPSKNKGWFMKPKALLECPYHQVCWIDTDCQVRANLEEIFQYIQPNKMALSIDKLMTSVEEKAVFNTGIIVFEGKPDILKEWVAIIEENPQIGDQEMLVKLLDTKQLGERRNHIAYLPNVYNWLRVQIEAQGYHPNAKIIHWTGIKGKEEIKKMMERLSK